MTAPSAVEIFGRESACDGPLTEAGAAERFARLHGDDLRYDHRRQRWLVWQAHRWVPDDDAAVTRIGLDFARAWQYEALDITDTKARESTVKLAIGLERRDRLTSLLAFARDLRPIADSGDRWDSDPWLLGVSNGVIDLRTGTLRAGHRDDRITMTAATPFDPAATCPRWERFIVEIFDGHADVSSYVHRAFGYCLTGDTSEQCLFFCYGAGSNGKGTAMNTYRRNVLGDYGHALAFSAIEYDPRPGAASNELAALLGRGFVVSSEASEARRLDEGRIKWITGGDPIRARFLLLRVVRVRASREVLAGGQPQAHRSRRLARVLAAPASDSVHARVSHRPDVSGHVGGRGARHSRLGGAWVSRVATGGAESARGRP